MRILLVGHFTPRTYYGIMNKLAHGFVRMGHTVELFDDRAVARASTIFRSRKMGITPMNARLLETCDWFRPDFILLGHCKTVRNSTLDAIRALLPAVKIAYRNVDWLVVADNRALIQHRTISVDAIFSTTAGEALRQFAGHRASIHYMPNPVDKAIDIGKAFENLVPDADVFYAVGGTYTGDPRPPFVTALQDACPDARFQIYGMFGVPHVFGAAYMEVLPQARMGLNYSRDNGQYLYSSDRMAQYMGNGLLALQDRAAGFSAYFSENEMGFYNTPEELAAHIRAFSADDAHARQCAENGWRKIHAVWASEMVAQYLIETTFRLPLTQDYHWPTAAA